VTFDNQNGTVGDNHRIGPDKDRNIPGNYTEAARKLDTSPDPSVRGFRESLGAFTGGGDQSETRAFNVAREGVSGSR
jgi:hypothetical protein